MSKEQELALHFYVDEDGLVRFRITINSEFVEMGFEQARNICNDLRAGIAKVDQMVAELEAHVKAVEDIKKGMIQ